MRINNAGHYEYCRWADKGDRNSGPNINNVAPAEFFQNNLASIRNQFLAGDMPSGCHECAIMEQHGKVSGRQKQLLKVGVRLEEFEKTMASSPWIPTFAADTFTQLPQDWQIDLGNYCNSACVFCEPSASSRLASEWKRIGFIKDLPPPNWCDNPVLVNRFVETLTQSPHIQYLHFIGGETVITPAFKIILEALIQAGLNRTATIGFTTNLSVWRDDVVELLTQFQGVNLGMSVESFKTINDYVRYPTCLPTMFENLDRWREVAKQCQWLLQLRITPTALTVGSMLGVYDFAWSHNITVESCNFLNDPPHLRASVLPMDYRKQIIDKMQQWIDARLVPGDTIVNIRDPNVAQQQIVQDLHSYVNYLKNEVDESWRLPDMMTFLKRLEASRGNSILDYLPEYEDLFRSAGY
jgi:sulfatase maturation enzyme AslB (radical SAM superfamily)